MNSVLIIDDEPNIRAGLKDNLEFDGFEVHQAADGQAGLDMVISGSFDLILLDVMMPKMNGFEVCKAIRKKGITTPIIFLTAKGEEIDRVLGFEYGADDFVQKPFSVRELMGRVKAILRRSEARSLSTDSFKLGRVTFDLKKYTAQDEEGPLKMSAKEFEIIGYLMQHKNTTVDRHQLLKNVWGYGEQPTTRTVDNFIVKLRQKIETDPANPAIILTIHGVGYKLVTD
jgi:DNA-binding response OmpR family regulator